MSVYLKRNPKQKKIELMYFALVENNMFFVCLIQYKFIQHFFLKFSFFFFYKPIPLLGSFSCCTPITCIFLTFLSKIVFILESFNSFTRLLILSVFIFPFSRPLLSSQKHIYRKPLNFFNSDSLHIPYYFGILFAVFYFLRLT